MIATCHSALPEALGDAALYIDPYASVSLVSAMRQVLSDAGFRANLGERAAARARAWTWEAAARQLIGVFEELAP